LFDNSAKNDVLTNEDNRNQALSALSRHSGMPLAGSESSVFLDSGQNRAGMTEG
jgi:hypothetical protein